MWFFLRIPLVNKYLIPIKGIKKTQAKSLLKSIIYSNFLFKVFTYLMRGLILRNNDNSGKYLNSTYLSPITVCLVVIVLLICLGNINMFLIAALWKKWDSLFHSGQWQCSSCRLCFAVLWKKSNFHSESAFKSRW